MPRHKTPLLDRAGQHPRPQDVQPQGRAGRGQQDAFPQDGGGLFRQRGERLLRKGPPDLQDLGRAGGRGLLFAPGRRAAAGLGPPDAGQPGGFFGGAGGGIRRGPRLDQPGHEVPLAALAGPDAADQRHIQSHAAGAVFFAGAAKGGKGPLHHIGQGKVGVPGQKRRHLALVLLGGEGAGGIDDLAAGGQGLRGAVQDGGPQSRALGHQGRRVLPEGLRLFAEHSLPRAGSVHQDAVEKGGQGLRDPLGALVQDDGVGHPHPLQVAFQHFGPGGDVLVGHQQPPALQGGGQLAGLAAGGGAQIQHPHPRLHPQQGRGRGGGGLLGIEHPRVVPGMAPGPEVRLPHQKARPAERRGLHGKIRPGRKDFRRHPQGRDGHAPGRLGFGRGVQLRKAGAQQGALPRFKIFDGHRGYLRV